MATPPTSPRTSAFIRHIYDDSPDGQAAIEAWVSETRQKSSEDRRQIVKTLAKEFSPEDVSLGTRDKIINILENAQLLGNFEARHKLIDRKMVNLATYAAENHNRPLFYIAVIAMKALPEGILRKPKKIDQAEWEEKLQFYNDCQKIITIDAKYRAFLEQSTPVSALGYVQTMEFAEKYRIPTKQDLNYINEQVLAQPGVNLTNLKEVRRENYHKYQDAPDEWPEADTLYSEILVRSIYSCVDETNKINDLFIALDIRIHRAHKHNELAPLLELLRILPTLNAPSNIQIKVLSQLEFHSFSYLIEICLLLALRKGDKVDIEVLLNACCIMLEQKGIVKLSQGDFLGLAQLASIAADMGLRKVDRKVMVLLGQKLTDPYRQKDQSVDFQALSDNRKNETFALMYYLFHVDYRRDERLFVESGQGGQSVNQGLSDVWNLVDRLSGNPRVEFPQFYKSYLEGNEIKLRFISETDWKAKLALARTISGDFDSASKLLIGLLGAQGRDLVSVLHSYAVKDLAMNTQTLNVTITESTFKISITGSDIDHIFAMDDPLLCRPEMVECIGLIAHAKVNAIYASGGTWESYKPLDAFIRSRLESWPAGLPLEIANFACVRTKENIVSCPSSERIEDGFTFRENPLLKSQTTSFEQFREYNALFWSYLGLGEFETYHVAYVNQLEEDYKKVICPTRMLMDVHNQAQVTTSLEMPDEEREDSVPIAMQGLNAQLQAIEQQFPVAEPSEEPVITHVPAAIADLDGDNQAALDAAATQSEATIEATPDEIKKDIDAALKQDVEHLKSVIELLSVRSEDTEQRVENIEGLIAPLAEELKLRGVLQEKISELFRYDDDQGSREKFFAYVVNRLQAHLTGILSVDSDYVKRADTKKDMALDLAVGFLESVTNTVLTGVVAAASIPTVGGAAAAEVAVPFISHVLAEFIKAPIQSQIDKHEKGKNRARIDGIVNRISAGSTVDAAFLKYGFSGANFYILSTAWAITNTFKDYASCIEQQGVLTIVDDWFACYKKALKKLGKDKLSEEDWNGVWAKVSGVKHSREKIKVIIKDREWTPEQIYLCSPLMFSAQSEICCLEKDLKLALADYKDFLPLHLANEETFKSFKQAVGNAWEKKLSDTKFFEKQRGYVPPRSEAKTYYKAEKKAGHEPELTWVADDVFSIDQARKAGDQANEAVVSPRPKVMEKLDIQAQADNTTLTTKYKELHKLVLELIRQREEDRETIRLLEGRVAQLERAADDAA